MVVFDGVGVVYPVWLCQNQTANHTMVSLEELSELPGCVGRLAAGAVAETNYYNVRQSYRTCTHYRVSYRCLGSSSIINYEKCESSLNEIKILREVIGYPEPVKDTLDEIQRREHIVHKLRRLAVEAEGLTAALPTLPVKNWLDGTVADATKDVYFEDYDLAKLLRFIADVGVNQGD